jgi:hypothetical protein
MVITGFAVRTEYKTSGVGHRTEVSDSLSQAGTEKPGHGRRVVTGSPGGRVLTVIDSCQPRSGEAMTALLANSITSAFVLVVGVRWLVAACKRTPLYSARTRSGSPGSRIFYRCGHSSWTWPNRVSIQVWSLGCASRLRPFTFERSAIQGNHIGRRE